MGGIVKAIFGGSNNSSLLEAQQIQQQQAQIQQDQGQQLRILSQSQSKADNESAGLAGPGLGRALLTYNKTTGSAGTLGG